MGLVAESPRVVIVEDHPVMQVGMEEVLRRRGATVIGTADSAALGYRTVLGLKPDVAVVDVLLPGESGITLTRRLLTAEPDLRILLYTTLSDATDVRDAMRSGARGIALKGSAFEHLAEAVLTVAGGGEYIDPGIEHLTTDEEPRKGVLSPREREVLALVARGLNAEEIGAQLDLAPATVRTHVRNAKRRLGARTRAQAVTVALRGGEIEP